jgi:hypothetical protein
LNIDEPEEKVARGYRFNPDPKWQKFVYDKYARIIAKIAFKYCSADADLRQDLEQEAMIALMTIDPTEVKGYEDYDNGLITEKEWNRKLDTYLRQVCRNSVLAPLQTTATGNWMVGRKKKRKNPETGESEYVPTPAMFVRIDQLLQAVQIGTDGTIHVRSGIEIGNLEHPNRDTKGGQDGDQRGRY